MVTEVRVAPSAPGVSLVRTLPPMSAPSSATLRPASSAAVGTSSTTSMVIVPLAILPRSEEHTSELQSLMRISYAVFCLKKKKLHRHKHTHNHHALTLIREYTI